MRFWTSSKDSVKTIMHLMPLQKIYIAKSGQELFDVCTQLLERLDVSWEKVSCLIGNSKNNSIATYLSTAETKLSKLTILNMQEMTEVR